MALDRREFLKMLTAAGLIAATGGLEIPEGVKDEEQAQVAADEEKLQPFESYGLTIDPNAKPKVARITIQLADGDCFSFDVDSLDIESIPRDLIDSSDIDEADSYRSLLPSNRGHTEINMRMLMSGRPELILA